jgi:hypothetical protein
MQLYSDPKDYNEEDRETLTALFNNNTVPKISQDNKNLCDCNIPLKEVGEALKDF